MEQHYDEKHKAVRMIVGDALLTLRRENFSSPAFNSLGFVWSTLWWEEIERLHKPFVWLRDFVLALERDDTTQGEGTQLFLELKTKLLGFANELPAAKKAGVLSAMQKREPLFLSMFACVSNLLEVCFRGKMLPAEKKS